MKLGHTWRTGCTVATRVSRERGVNDARNVSGINVKRRETERKIINNDRLFSPPAITVETAAMSDSIDSTPIPSLDNVGEGGRERVARDSIIVSSGIPYREGDARDLERGA